MEQTHTHTRDVWEKYQPDGAIVFGVLILVEFKIKALNLTMFLGFYALYTYRILVIYLSFSI